MIAAEAERVWELVADPYNLPRWWPRTTRVEDVRADDGLPAWTTVLETERGTGVRADYRCTESEPGARLRWEQELEGTPFERILTRSAVEIQIAAHGGATRLTLVADEALRGLARLGGPMINAAARRRLDEALDGAERALGGNR